MSPLQGCSQTEGVSPAHAQAILASSDDDKRNHRGRRVSMPIYLLRDETYRDWRESSLKYLADHSEGISEIGPERVPKYLADRQTAKTMSLA
jgi:hypothetical protein